MKKTLSIIAALALALGMTQCKKAEVPQATTDEGIFVTFTASYGGERTSFDPTGCSFTWTDGATEYIYVGCEGMSDCIGELSATGNGSSNLTFAGTLTQIPANGATLRFFYLGKGQHSDATTLNFSNQDGNLSNLTNYHIAVGSATYNGSNDFSATLNPLVAFAYFDLNDFGTGNVYLRGNDVYSTATIDYSAGTITGDAKGWINIGEASTGNYVALIPSTNDETALNFSSSTKSGSFPFLRGICAGKYYSSNNGNALEVTADAPSDFVDLSNVTTTTYPNGLTLEDGDILTGTLDGTTNADQRVKISIADGAHITLSNAHILGYKWGNYLFAGLNCIGDATIILDEGTTNEVQGFNPYFPGILIPAEKTLTIDANGAGTGSLDVCCKSEGQGAAGIGGQAYDSFTTETSCGNIVINGGVITATGAPGINGSSPAPGGAGIGGGWNVSCGTITINGGTVTANGGQCSAGIGTSSGGESTNGLSNCGSVTINGGVVVANGGTNAAGIGSGCNKQQVTCSCSSVTINGGTVTATGGRNGAGIGSGYAYGTGRNIISSCGNISITGGTVTATGGDYSAGIGAGYKKGPKAVSQCGSITIDAGVTSVTATKGSYATYSIGAGQNGTCGTVTIGGVEGAISESPYTYPQP